MTLLLSNDDVQQVLTMPVCLDALEHTFRDFATGRAVNRPRSHSYTQTGPGRFYLFKSMDGGLPRYGVHALRLSSDITHEQVENGRHVRRKLPVAPGGKWLGLVLLFSLETTELLAIIQDGFLQRMRVGATSGLAAKYLSRPQSRVAGMFGTGWQAGAQLMALCAVRTLDLIKVYSPRSEGRQAFAAQWTDKLGVPVQAVDEPRTVVDGSDIVVCATNALEPVLAGDWLQPGQHVNSVQGHELDWRTLERSDLIVVRSRETPSFYAVGTEQPREMTNRKEFPAGLQARVHELGEIVAEQVRRTTPEQITLFGGGGMGGSAGLGIQFAAVGARVYELARQAGLGRELPTDWFLETLKP